MTWRYRSVSAAEARVLPGQGLGTWKSKVEQWAENTETGEWLAYSGSLREPYAALLTLVRSQYSVELAFDVQEIGWEQRFGPDKDAITGRLPSWAEASEGAHTVLRECGFTKIRKKLPGVFTAQESSGDYLEAFRQGAECSYSKEGRFPPVEVRFSPHRAVGLDPKSVMPMLKRLGWVDNEQHQRTELKA